MHSPAVVFSVSLVAFGAMHAVVLTALTSLANETAKVSPAARGARLAAEFVVTEAALVTFAVCTGLVPLSPPTARDVLVVPAACLLFWEAWFYAGHRALHTRALYRFHRPHHAVRGVHPSLSFTAAETALLSAGFYVPLALAAHLAHAVSVATLAVTFTVAYALNVASHLERNLLGEAHDAGPLRHLVNSARYHAAHHRRPDCNYGLVSPWLDRLFGTEFRATRPG